MPLSDPASNNVLIVDDEEPIRHLIERILQKAGYITATAVDGVDAMQVAAGLGALDLLVTDMMMPAMTGDELARRLRRDHPRLKVLYFTGYSDSLFEKKGTMWADEAYLEKPCSPRGLVEAVALLQNQNQRIGPLPFSALVPTPASSV